MSYLFTSESVSEGHPDKVADQISDSVLDAILSKDPTARVACETFVTTGLVVIGGEITTRFVLKVLVAALISGSVFGYYMTQMRADDAALKR